MKKKSLLCVAVALCAIAAGSGAFALADWYSYTKNADNLVTVGRPVTTSLSGNLRGEGLLPGEEVSQDFTVSIGNANADKDYRLEILDVQDGTATGGAGSFEIAVVKKPSAAQKRFVPLAASDNLIGDLANGDVLEVTVRLKADADVSVAGATLRFALRIHEA